MAFMDYSDEEQEEDEDMLLVCILVVENIWKQKKKGPYLVTAENARNAQIVPKFTPF